MFLRGACNAARRCRLVHPIRNQKETTMADDKTNAGGQDRKRINLNEDYEVRDWTKSLGVTEQQLREAVKAVGDSAAKVREHLKK